MAINKSKRPTKAATPKALKKKNVSKVF